MNRSALPLVLMLAAACSGAPSRESTPAGERTVPSWASLPEREVAARVYLMGIDGAGWDVLDPAMDAGLMPNLRRLVERGSRGTLRSMEPTASAILWTTLATGKHPDKHGIRGFVVPSAQGDPVPVTSNLRRVKALWNIASESRVSVGFLGWWATWPAETVRGFMCSDYTWPLRKDEQGFATGVDASLRLPRRTYPPELVKELDRFVKTEQRVGRAGLVRLGLSAIPRVEGYAVREMFLKDISLGDMIGYLLDRYEPALFAVYFDGLDAYYHLFWPIYRRYVEARDLGGPLLEALDPRERALGEAFDRHLRRLDAYLGEIVRRAGPDAAVLVFSDHGYGDNPDGKVLRGYDEWIEATHWHTLDGILAAAGGPIRRGERPAGAGVLDVAPTVLALLGLPVAEDMDGRVLDETFTTEFSRNHPVTHVDTYETGERGDDLPVPSAYDEEVLERLRSLGYLD